MTEGFQGLMKSAQAGKQIYETQFFNSGSRTHLGLSLCSACYLAMDHDSF
jgi:hypothetical protein